ncbi:MAG TPA: serine/threonine-protein kinase, partial [Polyangiaceae bacterium]|nr:serine/threonine-protein kinase [Polyangiaceae bacterium]
VAGKYRIERPLGSGGMGVVVCATHLQLNQLVALKFLVDSALDAHVAGERFLREARATFRLRSEHTVRAMDVGTLSNGQPFIVMELLEGMDFKQLVAERGPLPPQEAVLYLLQVCSALQEAHAVGIIHRDLKARNLFLTRRVDGAPCVKVLDFGISKLGEDEAPLTLPDVGMGSPRYMAPEQWSSAATVDARADIYAAGAVLYELLTGQLPLGGMALAEVIKRLRAGAIPSPKDIRPELPDALCRALMKALRPHPEERYPTAMHFAQALREAMPEAETRALPKPVMAMTMPTAVISPEVMRARAQLAQKLAGAAPASSRDSEDLSTTVDQRPAVGAPATRAAAAELSMQDDYEQEQATTVMQPGQAQQAMATLQAAQGLPQLQALREPGGATKVSPRLERPPTPAIPIDLPPLDATHDEPHLAPPAYAPPAQPPAAPGAPAAPRWAPMPTPQPVSRAPTARAPGRGIPAWLFWTLLVVSFCFAGGVAAALLTRWFQ